MNAIITLLLMNVVMIFLFLFIFVVAAGEIIIRLKYFISSRKKGLGIIKIIGYDKRPRYYLRSFVVQHQDINNCTYKIVEEKIEYESMCPTLTYREGNPFPIGFKKYVKVGEDKKGGTTIYYSNEAGQLYVFFKWLKGILAAQAAENQIKLIFVMCMLAMVCALIAAGVGMYNMSLLKQIMARVV